MKISNPFASRSSWGRLVESAMRHAERLGDRAVGAEHLLLACLDEGDGTAASAFRRAGNDPSTVEDAIRWVHASALRSVGIERCPTPRSPSPPVPRVATPTSANRADR